ncbi:MAG TPA: hypothetical protein DEP72_00940 [Clostridiales bacterium]|nr:MAG: hypothetical protein A2Y18_05035 [Clostridiales bacterium GWD2_32_19]HCC06719.1 hypothetical protein [Clostridiales bacterium]
MKILLATNNENKLKDMQKFLPSHVTLITLNEAGICLEPDENGDIPEENARIKAEEFWNEVKRKNLDITAVVADDVAVYVEAFPELIGVKAARWHKGTSEDRNNKLLEIMKNEKNRNIYYETVVSYKDEHECLFFKAYNYGEVSKEIREGTGFAYDFIFKLPDGRMLSEISQDERDGMIGRAVAARELSDYIKTKMDL